MQNDNSICPACGQKTGKPYTSLLTRNQVADWLNVHVATVKNLEKRGKIPVVKVTPDGARYRPCQIKRYIEGREIFLRPKF